MKFTFETSEKTHKTDDVVFIEAVNKNGNRIIERDGVNFFLVEHSDTEKAEQDFPLTMRAVVRAAQSAHKKKVVLDLDTLTEITGSEVSAHMGEVIATNMEMANYEFREYKKKPKEGWSDVEEVIFVGVSGAQFKKGVRTGKVIGEETNKCRDLANMPGGDMTPKRLVQKTRAAVKGTGIKMTVLGKKDMEKQKMGAILGVAQGSREEPQLIVLEYKGGAKTTKPVALVGKGVTFDTGGINIKPSDAILGMNMDMSGGAAVVHTIVAASRLKLKKNIVGIIPAVENMPSGSSYRPGDVLRSMSGKTIEILNTDAEGRVILADGITYAKKYTPSTLIDVATLTGAAMVALGDRMSAVFSKDDDLAEEIVAAGMQSHDYAWRMPLWDEHQKEVKGGIGDVTNLHNKGSRYGGAIHGAAFLWEFAQELKCPWAHIDMAPRMLATSDEYLAQGAAGSPVRLLTQFLRE